MKTIHKYRLQITASQPVLIPKGAHILTIQAQDDIPCLWALVDPDQATEMRILEMYGTGDPIHESGKPREYIGTFQIKGGESVFHVFEYVRSGDTDKFIKT